MNSCKITIGNDDSYNYYNDFQTDVYTVEHEEMEALVDVAFNDNIQKTKKLSFNKTIDVQIGRYMKEGSFKGCLTVNFKATHGLKDWIINALCFGFRRHAGYAMEIKKYKADLLNEILFQVHHPENDIILIAGRSKGAAEALMLCDSILTYTENFGISRVAVGAFAPPMCMSKSEGQKKAKRIGMANIYTVIHRADIVPKLFPWFHHVPGYMIEFGEKKRIPSVKVHEKVTTDRSVYDFL